MCNGNPQVSRKLDYSARDEWVRKQKKKEQEKDELKSDIK